MKSILISFCLTIVSISVFAREGFFIQPGVGLGVTTTRSVDLKGVHNSPRIPAFGYSARIGLGYQNGKLEVSSGVGLLRTGYKSKNVLKSIDLEGYYGHVAIPVLFGLHVGNEKKLKVVPTIGAYGIYTYSSSITYWAFRPNAATVKVVSKGDLLHKTYRPFTVMGTAQVSVQKQIKPRFAITCTPGLIGSLGNMLTHAYGKPKRPNQYNFAALIELGMRWSFAGKKDHVSTEEH